MEPNRAEKDKPEVVCDCTCWCRDCKDVMAEMQDGSVDFVLTDIPYELDLNGGGAGGDFAERRQLMSRKDNSLYFVSNGIDYDAVFSEFIRLCSPLNVCLFCSNKQVGKIMTWWEGRGYVATLLVWEKPNPLPTGNRNYINNLEFIVYVRGKGSTYNNLGYAMQKKTFHDMPPTVRLHETEKPLGILRRLLLLHTNEGDLVFDPYAGSFTTAIACLREGRKFVGCEILPKYYDKAVERLRARAAQQALF